MTMRGRIAWLRVLAIGCAVALASCADLQPPRPAGAQQAVYALESEYAAALQAAVAYKRLPTCDGTVRACSKPEVVDRLRSADLLAWGALTTAEAVVRAGQPSDLAVAEARKEVSAFSAAAKGIR
jgi:hypothetical protein